MLRVPARNILRGLTQLDDESLFGGLERSEGAKRLRVLLEQSRKPSLQESLRGLLDPPAGLCQLVGAADQSLERFIGVVSQEQPACAPDLRSRTVAPARQSFSACLGFDDHFLHQVVEPGQFSRPSHAWVAQQNHRHRDHPSQASRVDNRSPPTAAFGSVFHRLKSLRFRTTV
jgi:hypothetical protein